MDDADRTHKNIAEARERKIPVLPPDINQSRDTFTVVNGSIRFGLGGIKGVGAKAISAILAERDASEPFRGLDDLVRRVRSAHANRRVFESLIKCGALDSTGVDRASLLAGLDDVMRWANNAASNLDQHNLFAGGANGEPERFTFPAATNWSQQELLAAEKETLGFFITAHPLDRFEKQLARLVTCKTVDLRNLPGQTKVTLAGVIQGLRLKNSKKGDRYATFFLEDKHGIVEVIAWPDTFRKNEPLITGSDPVCMGGRLDVSEERRQIIAEDFTRLEEARARSIRELQISLDARRVTREDVERIQQTLARYPGPCPTFLHVVREAYETRIALEKLGVATSHEVIAALAERVAGAEARFVS